MSFGRRSFLAGVAGVGLAALTAPAASAGIIDKAVMRSLASAYAVQWALSYNGKYPRYPGVDCANFVSQCLVAGGWKQDATWKVGSYAWINVPGLYNYWRGKGSLGVSSANSIPGDLVFVDWTGNGSMDHVMIVSGKSGSDPLVSGHTDPMKNKSFASLKKSYPYGKFWFVRIP